MVEDAPGVTRRMRLDDWTANELPGRLDAAWNEADALYDVITVAIEGGAAGAIEHAVARLHELEQASERQAVAEALVHLAVDRPGEAEQVLRRYIRKHADTAIIATNLAKVMWSQGRERDARVQLRHALSLDPNLENALQWWASIHGSEGGDASYQQALGDIAAEPDAWRARILLGRQYVQHGRLNEAREAFEAVARDFQDPAVAAMLEHEMAALRPTVAAGPPPAVAASESARMASVPLFSPVWTRGLDDPDWIFDAALTPGPNVCVFAFADARPGLGDATVLRGLPETPESRLTRALPLYLAESLSLRTNARVATIIPVVLNGGLFLATAPFGIDLMVRYCPPVFTPRYVIGGTLLDRDQLALDMWDVETPQLLWSENMPSIDPVMLARRIDERVRATLLEGGGAGPRPPAYAARFVPEPEELQEAYLHAQGFLLTQLLAASRVIPATTLSSEQPMYNTYFGLCALYPQLLAPRLMALSGVLAGLHYRSAQATAYSEGVRALLAQSGSPVLERLAPLALRRLGDVDAARESAEKQLRDSDGDDDYARWLHRVMRGQT